MRIKSFVDAAVMVALGMGLVPPAARAEDSPAAVTTTHVDFQKAIAHAVAHCMMGEKEFPGRDVFSITPSIPQLEQPSGRSITSQVPLVYRTVGDSVSGTAFALPQAWGCPHAKLEATNCGCDARGCDFCATALGTTREFGKPRPVNAYAAGSCEPAA
jgi:hypothetical protein